MSSQAARPAAGGGPAALGVKGGIVVGKKYLGKAEILALQDLKTEEVFVAEWDCTVIVRTMSGAERDYFESSVVTRKGKVVTSNLQNIRARLVALCVVDEAGQRVFGEEDEYALGTKSAAALNTIFEVAQRLNKMTDTDVEELASNSNGDLSEGSRTD